VPQFGHVDIATSCDGSARVKVIVVDMEAVTSDRCLHYLFPLSMRLGELLESFGVQVIAAEEDVRLLHRLWLFRKWSCEGLEILNKRAFA
jgi:hypothetical protein